MLDRETIIRLARFKSIPSAPNYWADESGEIYNHAGKRLAQQVTKKGYCRVHLFVNGETKSRSVHSLVAEAFIGPRPTGFHVRHIDGNKTNNALANIAYGTPKENEADKTAHGTKPVGARNGAHTKSESRPKGERHGSALLSASDVLMIRKTLESPKRGDGAMVAKLWGVSSQTISDIVKRKTWGHV